MSEMLSELLKSLGVDKLTNAVVKDNSNIKNLQQPVNKSLLSQNNDNTTNVFAGTVSLPSVDNLSNPANSSSVQQNSAIRQAMLMRIDYLFENDISTKLSQTTLKSPSDLDTMLKISSINIPENDHKTRNLLNKPVVIGDAIPVPSNASITGTTHIIHESVEQMLQAALAHHNLGNFEESLKFLEASRVQLFTIERMNLIKKKQKELEKQREIELEINEDASSNSKILSKITNEMIENVTVSDSEVQLPIHIEMYIILCKGNVYQSCGDDEQALHCYIMGWTRAVLSKNTEWEIVCINSIGLIAYYNVRFEIALTCFAKVALFRQEVYGLESPDTATAWNNEASCLYCINKRGEARVKFERAWNLMCKVLGHRHPRSVTVWKNLDKARRSQAAVNNLIEINESIKLRPDAEFLISGNFNVNAILPEGSNGVGGNKKKSKKGGKKKK